MHSFLPFIILLSLLSACNPFDKTVRIGVIDSFFCHPKNIQYNDLIIKRAFGANDEGVGLATAATCANKKKNKKRLHGDSVIRTFLSNVTVEKKDHRIILYPVTVFNQNGVQTPQNWAKAMAYLKSKKVKYLCLATGLIADKKLAYLNKGLVSDFITFAAAGNKGGKLGKDSVVWPHIHLLQRNGIVFGHYLKPKYAPPKVEALYGHLDFLLLFADKVEYFVENPMDRPFAASSYAVSKSVGIIVSNCREALEDYDIKAIRNCLNKISKPLILLNLGDKKVRAL
jgi:hypothetical protein